MGETYGRPSGTWTMRANERWGRPSPHVYSTRHNLDKLGATFVVLPVDLVGELGNGVSFQWLFMDARPGLVVALEERHFRYLGPAALKLRPDLIEDVES